MVGKKRMKRAERRAATTGSSGERSVFQNDEIDANSDGDTRNVHGTQPDEPTTLSAEEDQEYSPNVAPESIIRPFTRSAEQAQKKLTSASDSIQELMNVLSKYSKDVENIFSIQAQCANLEYGITDRNERIQELEAAVRVFNKIKAEDEKYMVEKEASIETERQTLDEEREQFERRKRKFEKSFELRTLEQQAEYDAKCEKLKKYHDEELETHKTQCEKRFVDTMKAHDARHKDVLARLEEKSKELIVQTENHRMLQKKFEDLEVLRDDAKSKSEQWKLKFEELRNDFGLENRPIEFYTKGFDNIFKSIVNVSLKYFQAFDETKIDEMQKILLSSSSSFKGMPFSDSEESRKLRIAYAQQTISTVIYEFIFQPFSTEGPPLDPIVLRYFNDISTELAGMNHGKHSARISRIWTTMTVRGLNFLAQRGYGGSNSDSLNTWTLNVTQNVFTKLLPLADPTLESNMLDALTKIISDAITLWKKVQADEIQLTASLNLSIKQRDTWRSQSLDSAIEGQLDIEASTRPRIFILFPCITAVSCVAERNADTPQIEMIHPGSGILECSSWVIAGREEERSRLEYIEMATKQAKRESYEKSRKLSSQSRRGSTATVAALPRILDEEYA